MDSYRTSLTDANSERISKVNRCKTSAPSRPKVSAIPEVSDISEHSVVDDNDISMGGHTTDHSKNHIMNPTRWPRRSLHAGRGSGVSSYNGEMNAVLLPNQHMHSSSSSQKNNQSRRIGRFELLHRDSSSVITGKHGSIQKKIPEDCSLEGDPLHI
ncbi:hypothetical protein AB6A40_001958 [Gnathostoma spinigerum]|uniref:Uncharacterized protein n=1 Tax=Gnathostoma spinigerum TaxID=75299 RepID=A0ABD6EAT2_9BILA